MRVHAVSPNVLLPRALEAAMAGAEITTSTDPSDTPEALDAEAVVVIDLESTERGLAAVTYLRHRGTTCSMVVVGDGLPRHVPDERTTFLVRPVPMGELRDAIAQPLRRPEGQPDGDPAARVAPRPPSAGAIPAPQRIVTSGAPPSRGWRERLELRRPTERTSSLGSASPARSTSPAQSSSAFQSFDSTVAGALPVCRDLLRALEAFPALASVGVTAQAFVDDLLETLPQSRTAVALVTKGAAYLEVAGYRGLTAAERLLRVPVAHPLVAESAGRSTPLLLVARETADLVTGVPGTRAPALLVRALTGPEGIHGLVVVGGGSFDADQVTAAADAIDRGSGVIVLASYIEQLASRGLTSPGQPSREVG